MDGIPAIVEIVDLAHPLSSIAPSLEAEVLTVLSHTRAPLTGRKVAGLARRGSHAQVRAVLQRLVQHGLVHVEPAGRANLYRFNEDHLLARAVHAANIASSELRARLVDRIGQWKVPCVHASLFGSLARAEAGPDSDIDVLVVRPTQLDGDDLHTWDEQLAVLEDTVRSWTGNSLAWFETTEADLQRAAIAREPILVALREEAVDLAGEPLAAMLCRLGIQAVVGDERRPDQRPKRGKSGEILDQLASQASAQGLYHGNADAYTAALKAARRRAE